MAPPCPSPRVQRPYTHGEEVTMCFLFIAVCTGHTVTYQILLVTECLKVHSYDYIKFSIV
jgi:hypothetical protein